MTECVTDYINFCEDNNTRTVRRFPNIVNLGSSMIWKSSWTRKKRVLRTGDSELLRSVQRELKVKIRDNMEVYRRKLENKLQENNVQDVWSGIKKIRLQAEGGSDRWKSGHSKWTELILQQVLSRDKLSILLSFPQLNRPPLLTHSVPVTFQLSHVPPHLWILLLVHRCLVHPHH